MFNFTVVEGLICCSVESTYHASLGRFRAKDLKFENTDYYQFLLAHSHLDVLLGNSER